MKEKRVLVINLKKTILILSLTLVVILFLIQMTSRLDIEPSEKLNGSTNIFEQRENYFFSYEIIRYHSRVNISEITNITTRDIGINADKTNLHLGRIPRGSSSKKTINLTNNQGRPYRIKFLVFGNISELIRLEDSIVIKPGENVEYSVIAETAESTPIGMYSGEIDLVIVKPKNFISKAIQWVI
ncbi:MAG: hypothetical protein GF368_03540 [Candidatus Aenigmarchaeota archaeon]|nr:hypothetical protein [Candidatus Aenigmarchaeota archaeon]